MSERPKIVIHMMSALDGKITGPFFDTQSAKVVGEEYDRINAIYNPEAVLVGRITSEENFTKFEKPELDENAPPVPEGDYVAKLAKNYFITVDMSGKLGWKKNILEYDSLPESYLIEVLSSKASNAYKAYLRKLEISYIIAGDDQLDCDLCVKKLQDLFHIKTLVVGGGGIINWSFIQAGIVDEVSVLITPVTDGENNTATVFEKSPNIQGETIEFALKGFEKIAGDGLWIQYTPKYKKE